MNVELVERLAREAGFQRLQDGIRDGGESSDYWDCWPEQLARFAALVAEECSRLCAEYAADTDPSFKPHEDNYRDGWLDASNECNWVIRQRFCLGAPQQEGG